MTEKNRRFSTMPAAEKADAVARWLDEHKARDIVVLDLAGKSTLTDIVIIATAASVRQGQSLAEGVLELCKQENFEFLRTEGQTTGQWLLLDMNDIVVNIFQEQVREMFNLENLWRDATVLRDGRVIRHS